MIGPERASQNTTLELKATRRKSTINFMQFRNFQCVLSIADHIVVQFVPARYGS
jgi:hypothetical protein